MEPDYRELCGLKGLTFDDWGHFQNVMDAVGAKTRLAFFPWLYSITLSRKRTLCWESVDGSLCLYVVKKTSRGMRMDLYFPPLPFSDAALAHAGARIARFNRESGCRIDVVEERDCPRLETQGWTLREQGHEYIFDRDKVIEAKGKAFARLRRNVNKARRTPGLHMRPFQIEDAPACRALADEWRARVIAQNGGRDPGISYVHRCLTIATDFPSARLQGRVFTVDNDVVAFSFDGRISRGYGAIYVGISSHTCADIGYLQRALSIEDMADVRFINDGSDADREGLGEIKRAFRPVELHRLYRAKLAP